MNTMCGLINMIDDPYKRYGFHVVVDNMVMELLFALDWVGNRVHLYGFVIA